MAKRHLGQHFLSDPGILRRIADALDPAPGDRVLEIGPGRGTLTRVLRERGVRLTVIERDRDLVPALRQLDDIAVIEGDALVVDWPAAVGAGPGDRWLVIGNIPYNITSPLIDRALTPPRPARVVFLVQREVADRLGARPGTAAYGALTVGVQATATVERLFTVAAGAFRPVPRVASAVVRLTPRAEPLIPDRDVAAFRRVVTGLFGARRKQLARGLRTAFGLEAAEANRLLTTLGIDPERRPETLSPGELVEVWRGLVDVRGREA